MIVDNHIIPLLTLVYAAELLLPGGVSTLRVAAVSMMELPARFLAAFLCIALCCASTLLHTARGGPRAGVETATVFNVDNGDRLTSGSAGERFTIPAGQRLRLITYSPHCICTANLDVLHGAITRIVDTHLAQRGDLSAQLQKEMPLAYSCSIHSTGGWTIHWDKSLGAGTSGHVFAASHAEQPHAQFAAKVTPFKAADGRSHREVALSIAAGRIGAGPRVFDAWRTDNDELLQRVLASGAQRDAGRRDGFVVLVMEKLRGRPLKQWLESAPRRVPHKLVVAEAMRLRLAALHRAGIAHQDAHATNWVLDFSNADAASGDSSRLPDVKLLDFGSATFHPGTTGVDASLRAKELKRSLETLGLEHTTAQLHAAIAGRSFLPPQPSAATAAEWRGLQLDPAAIRAQVAASSLHDVAIIIAHSHRVRYFALPQQQQTQWRLTSVASDSPWFAASSAQHADRIAVRLHLSSELGTYDELVLQLLASAAGASPTPLDAWFAESPTDGALRMTVVLNVSASAATDVAGWIAARGGAANHRAGDALTTQIAALSSRLHAAGLQHGRCALVVLASSDPAAAPAVTAVRLGADAQFVVGELSAAAAASDTRTLLDSLGEHLGCSRTSDGTGSADGAARCGGSARIRNRIEL